MNRERGPRRRQPGERHTSTEGGLPRLETRLAAEVLVAHIRRVPDDGFVRVVRRVIEEVAGPDRGLDAFGPKRSDGSLPAYKFGPRHIRIKLEDLEAMARRVVSASS